MPRTIAVESSGCPPLRALTFDILGLIKVIEAKGEQKEAPKVVERWGEPDASRCVLATSLVDREFDPLLGVARKNGKIEVLSPVNGDIHASISIESQNHTGSEHNSVVGLHLFRRERLGSSSRSYNLLTCTNEGQASLKYVKMSKSLEDSGGEGAQTTWNVCGSGSIWFSKVDADENHALFGGKGIEVNVFDLNQCDKESVKPFWSAKSGKTASAYSPQLGLHVRLSYAKMTTENLLQALIVTRTEESPKDIQQYRDVQTPISFAGVDFSSEMNLASLPFHLSHFLSFHSSLPTCCCFALQYRSPLVLRHYLTPTTIIYFIINYRNPETWRSGGQSQQGWRSNGKSQRGWRSSQLPCVRLYDISAQRRPVVSFDFRETPIKAVAEDVDGHTIYVGNGSGDLASFDIRTGKLLGSFLGKCSGSIRSIVRHPELPVIASCGLDSYLRIWDVKSRQLLSATSLSAGLPLRAVFEFKKSRYHIEV
ncbi:putative calcium-dependent protein kinase 3-like [Capsicum annuum]|nr:putative calcium-dependent protein kinase 3-like [Capsicum annuum]